MRFFVAFFATFYFTGSNEPVGPTIYGGKTHSDCSAYAADLITRIKRGQGKNYQPVEFRCEQRGSK